MGHPADARAETLSPAEWRELASACADHPRARARSTSACSSARPRADGLHPLVSVFQPVSLADELTLDAAPGEADARRLPGRRGREPGRRARWPSSARHGLGRPPPHADDRQARSRSPPAWAAVRPTPPPRCGSPSAASGLPIPRRPADAPGRRRPGAAAPRESAGDGRRGARRAPAGGRREHARHRSARRRAQHGRGLRRVRRARPPALTRRARGRRRPAARRRRAARRQRSRSRRAAPVPGHRDRAGGAAKRRRPAPDGHRLRPHRVRLQRGSRRARPPARRAAIPAPWPPIPPTAPRCGAREVHLARRGGRAGRLAHRPPAQAGNAGSRSASWAPSPSPC